VFSLSNITANLTYSNWWHTTIVSLSLRTMVRASSDHVRYSTPS